MSSDLPKRVTTHDPHLIQRIVAVQLLRRYRTASRCLEALASERIAQIEMESIAQHLRPLASPPTIQNEGRAGACSSSRRAKRATAVRRESAA